MRCLLAAATAAALFGAAAHSEERTFIVANNPDSYGVDRCLASGARCGTPVATAYCRSHEFLRALSFHKLDRDDITGAITKAKALICRGGACAAFVAIECTR